MPTRPGKPCRFQSTQAALRTPIGQQQHSNKIQPVPGAHGCSVTNRTAGRVDAVAPSSPPTTQLRDWGPETGQQPAPIVDNFVDEWEQDVPPHSVAYTDDVEDVYHTSAPTTRSSWGGWSGGAAVANTLWEADRWNIQPADEPITLDQNEVEELGEFNSVRSSDDSQDAEAAAPMQVSADSEDDPRRYKYHSSLYAAAKQGYVTEVELILRTMSEDGLPPGSAALHSLVFAHVKAGQSQEGLEAARNILKLGLPLLEETYIALLYGLAEEGRVEDAEGVIVSMYNNAGGTIRNGWLALTKGLFRKGDNITVAFQHLQKGLQEGWNPDASLFEYVIHAFCKADNIEQAQRVLASMPDLGCPPRTVHINLLVELVARLQGLDAALEFIQDTYAQLDERAQTEVGAESTHKAVPNNDTFCAVFRGFMHEKGPEMQSGSAVETFGKVTAAMMSADVFVGPQIMAYGLDLFLMDGELESSLEQISSLRTVAGEGWSEYVDDAKMLALLTACGSADRPVDLAVLLRELERRKRHMPCAVLPTKPDSAGRPVSALTSWLPSVAADDDKKSELPAPVSEDPMFIDSFAQKSALILERADLPNYDGSISTMHIEVKAPKFKGGEIVEDAVYKEVHIGIGKCAVGEDGLPLKVNSMLKVHLMGELQARGFQWDPKTKAADLKSEIKLQRDIIEPQIETFQQLDGGVAMGQVQSLMASGMSAEQAMAEVQNRFSSQSMGSIVQPPVTDAIPDESEEAESDEEAEDDEFGVSLATEVIVTEYVSWQKLRREKKTYGDLNEEERKAFRTMEKYTSPGTSVKSTQARRTEALESVMDDAQAQLDGRSGWQSDAGNGGLLSQFEGDLHLGEGDEGETSLSDGVGGPSADGQDDASEMMMAAGDEDSSSMIDLDPDDDDEGTSDADEDDPTAGLASGEDAGDSDEEQSGLEQESLDGDDDEDDTVSLLEDGDSDDEEDSSTLLDLTRFTNDSAGVEVAMECLRCARRVGVVISRGDFENSLAAAKHLRNPQYMTLLHGWALEQAMEVFTAAELDGPDAEAVRSFTISFCEMARQALLDVGCPAEAVEPLAENEQVLVAQVSTEGV